MPPPAHFSAKKVIFDIANKILGQYVIPNIFGGKAQTGQRELP